MLYHKNHVFTRANFELIIFLNDASFICIWHRSEYIFTIFSEQKARHHNEKRDILKVVKNYL